MRRNHSLSALAAGALLFGATALSAAPPARSDAAARVTAVTVVPGAGSADVVLSFAGELDVAHFTLEGPHRIVVDLRGATLQTRAPAYDRVDRAGIRNVRLGQFDANVVRLVLDVDGPRAYEVTRTDSEVRVSVRGGDSFSPWSSGIEAARAVPQVPVAPSPVAPAPVREVASAPMIEPLRAATPVQQATEQPRITVTFSNMSIFDVLAHFSAFSGRTFITGSGVTGTVRFTEIVNQPWDVALSKVLQANGLQAVQDSTGIITVDSYRNLAQRVAAEPLVTQMVPVNYARASALAATIRQLIAACSSGSVGAESTVVDVAATPDPAAAAAGAAPAAAGSANPAQPQTCGRGVVTFDEKTNVLLITETVSRLPEIVSYVRDLDFRTPQVAIKAKIIAVDRTATQELGISYDFGSPTNFSNQVFTRPGSTGEFTIGLGGDAFIGVANANRSFSGTSSLNLIYNVVMGGNSLTTFLDALSSQNLSDVQAEPSTTTIDNRKATLFAGTEIAYLLTPPVIPGQIAPVTPTINRQKVGITLEVTPRVTANRQITMEIKAIQQSVLGITVAGPEISERQSTNEVLVGDGETAVIAGLTQTQVSRFESGIPYLMKLPWIGRLFREDRTIERKQDLLILVTPHIVDEGEAVRNNAMTPRP
ncbi:AMIN domain-containing protein [Pseudogemmatithrix spongiicola]|uniref:AMIN domain-containing protein n=1 Tax=Pseudogemmatithrix spongiicola TaxID=3062599 RepID=A0AA49Q8C2_9BACT|nr:AMIN domain-containing protein [Gemmatimonadaceae bacterium 'strain 138']WKW15942.1 AMIN domain-containing protein [Gemmatimonadaceae bacterium 'strain 318']